MIDTEKVWERIVRQRAAARESLEQDGDEALRELLLGNLHIILRDLAAQPVTVRTLYEVRCAFLHYEIDSGYNFTLSHEPWSVHGPNYGRMTCDVLQDMDAAELKKLRRYADDFINPPDGPGSYTLQNFRRRFADLRESYGPMLEKMTIAQLVELEPGILH